LKKSERTARWKYLLSTRKVENGWYILMVEHGKEQRLKTAEQ
jgi:hypothetical protein